MKILLPDSFFIVYNYNILQFQKSMDSHEFCTTPKFECFDYTDPASLFQFS